MPVKTLASLLTVAIASSALTISFERVLHPSPVQAQQSNATLQEYIVYAAPRGDGGSQESFIFVNPKTGDIWVYENRNVKEHYRVAAVGRKLDEVKP
jgi:hypothetical protein